MRMLGQSDDKDHGGTKDSNPWVKINADKKSQVHHRLRSVSTVVQCLRAELRRDRSAFALVYFFLGWSRDTTSASAKLPVLAVAIVTTGVMVAHNSVYSVVSIQIVKR